MSYQLFGDNLAEQTGQCSCGGAAPGEAHDPYCGWELVGPIGEIVAAFDAAASSPALREEIAVAIAEPMGHERFDDMAEEGPLGETVPGCDACAGPGWPCDHALSAADAVLVVVARRRGLGNPRPIG